MKKIIAIASAGLLALAFAAPVAADAELNDSGANCHGVIISTFAPDLNPAKAAKALGLSVKDVQALVKGICSL